MSLVYSYQGLVDGHGMRGINFDGVLGADERNGCNRNLGCSKVWFVDSVTDRFGCPTDLKSHSSETQHRQDKLL
jgi:hypothetical protein